jgi:hypothetical protein
MWKSLVSNFMKSLHETWKSRIEFHLTPRVKFRFHCADFYETRQCFIRQILVCIACTELAKFLLGPAVKYALYCSHFTKLTIIDCIRWRPLPNFIEIDFEICTSFVRKVLRLISYLDVGKCCAIPVATCKYLDILWLAWSIYVRSLELR